MIELRDERGQLIRDYEEEESERVGNIRTLKVKLDTNQYQLDVEEVLEHLTLDY